MSNYHLSLIIGAFGLMIAILLIVGALLGHAGITSVISRRGTNQRPENVRANLLIGSGLVLAFVSLMIPEGYKQSWVPILLWPSLCLIIFGILQFLILTLKKRS
jgi:hypothetical protein